MGSSGAATVAGRRRAGGGARGAAPSRKGGAKRAAAPKRPAAPKRAVARKRTPARKRRVAPRRTAARRQPLTRSLTGAASRVRRSWRAWLGALLVTAVALAAGYMLWLRDSSLVAIDDVEVVGARSGESERLVAELTAAAEGMTTLHLDRERLEAVASRFPTVASIEADPNFPHGLRIEVRERPPVLVVSDGRGEVAVAGDGTLLPGVAPPDEVPRLGLDQVPAGGSLGGEPLEQAVVMGGAPAELMPLVEKLSHSDEHGVEVILRGGIAVRFGTAARAGEKWAAASAVLADPKLDATSYVDVRVPERPAVGTL